MQSNYPYACVPKQPGCGGVAHTVSSKNDVTLSYAVHNLGSPKWETRFPLPHNCCNAGFTNQFPAVFHTVYQGDLCLET